MCCRAPLEVPTDSVSAHALGSGAPAILPRNMAATSISTRSLPFLIVASLVLDDWVVAVPGRGISAHAFVLTFKGRGTQMSYRRTP
jgi:hypothetical protein